MADIQSPNPGQVLASAVDAEIAKFRVLRDEIAKLRSDLQILLQQRAENDLVQQELDLVNESSATVYKKIGPVLMKQDISEARDTVKKRLEFINGERTKLEAKITSKEVEGNQLAVKVQQMQQNLQRLTAEAVQTIAMQHKNT